ncbi:MAG: NAD(P)-dependent oxidoreductase [Burkholderiales bacterium]|nr:NAD(P)-dependent oxidoreductase [Burkholderiales bacterium]
MNTTVAFIGLGAMGFPMAARLAAAGHALRVFDIVPATAARFAAERPACACTSPAHALDGADIAITMLPSSSEVESTLLSGEASAALRSGTTIIDMSSSEPMRTRALAQALAARGVTLVDAPVSGGVNKARDGSLAIMFGGTEEQLARCTPLLSAMGTKIFRTGEVGSGHAMKALNNFVSAAGLVAAVEALHVGEKFGLDPHVMTSILNASTGRNNTTENKVEQFMLSGKFDSGFGLALMEKDVGIAVKLAEALGVAVPQGKSCHELWAQATRSTKGADHTEMYRLL